MNDHLLDVLDKAKNSVEIALVEHLVSECRRYGFEMDERAVEALHRQLVVSLRLRWR